MKWINNIWTCNSTFLAISLAVLAGVCSAQEPTSDSGLSEAELTERYVKQRRAEFGQCADALKTRAASEGIPDRVIEDVLGNLSFLPRIIELDRTQSEFTQTFQDYIDTRVSDTRVETGRAMFVKHRNFLDQITREFGIPGQYLIAFWGLETNYGSFMGSTSTFDALATLGCDPRRSDFFTDELMIALQLLVANDLAAESFQGSWAGAVGHTQFMPSNYQRYALDGDADGKVDLWNSERDALRSAANFLKQLGWRSGERWGREVSLPENFDFLSVGVDNPKPLSGWATSGITKTDGTILPSLDIPTAVLVPQGHLGPVFAVYPNFDVIMRWNRSQSFAISVGHLADRINGAGRLRAVAPSDGPRLSRELVTQVQNRLENLGFETGGVDGVFGGGTKKALAQYQQKNGLVPDGFLDKLTLRELLAQ